MARGHIRNGQKKPKKAKGELYQPQQQQPRVEKKLCPVCGQSAVGTHVIATDEHGRQHCLFKIISRCPNDHEHGHCRSCRTASGGLVNHCTRFCKPVPRTDLTTDHYVQRQTPTEQSPWRTNAIPLSATGQTPRYNVDLSEFIKRK